MQQGDLEELGALQPDDWPDIVEDFRFYLRADFSFPVKGLLDGRIVGIGTLNVFGNTSWLAHVIVHTQYRNQGIGYRIVMELLKQIKKQGIRSCLLAATPAGRTVYLKAGFKEIGEYQFFRRERPWRDQTLSPKIVPLRKGHLSALYDLDRAVSGEARERLISCFLKDALVYRHNHELFGYYLPTLKEGLIFAVNATAGIELMKIKYATFDTAVIPTANVEAMGFLKEEGFARTGRVATRMALGENVIWQPQHVYGRIGGNFG